MENVDEAVNSAGRVTRSLRKRLLSADSDTSSRPTTPVVAKLASIAETTGSPSRSVRSTRRNSVSTPIETPVIIKTEISDPSSTPARRSTRRRSISILEEEAIAPPKLVTESKIDVLLEEDTTSKSTAEAAQVTRSKSKSPNTLQKNRDVKIGPKSKTRTTIQDSDEDPIVITVDSDEEIRETTPDKAGRKEIIDLGDDTPEKLRKDTISPNQSKDNLEETALLEQAVNVTENAAGESTKADESTNHQIAKKDDSTINDTTCKAVIIESVEILGTLSSKTQDNNVSAQATSPVRLGKSVSFSASQENVLKTAYPKTPAQRAKSYFNRDSPNETNDKSFQSATDSVSCLKNSNVDFHETEAPKALSEHDQQDHSFKGSADFQNVTNEDVEMMAHANTPYKTKLLPSILSSTPVIENSSELKASLNKNIHSKEEEADDFSSPEKFLRSGKSYGDPALPSSKTSPIRIKKNADETTSPSNPEKTDGKVSKGEHSLDKMTACSPTVGNSLKSDDEDELNRSKSKSEKGPYTEIETATIEGVDGVMKTSYATSWSQGVTVKEGQFGKIDTILPEESHVNDRVDKNEDNKIENSNNIGMKIDQVSEHFDEDEEEEELDDDEKAHEKSCFVDDEAMEVDDDYRSGDSMSEEERCEMEENEIIEDGESLGSKDSGGDDEDDDDKDSDSFIVSGSEEEMKALMVFSEDENIEKSTDKTRKYNRIEAPVSDSETDDENVYGNMRSQDSKNTASQALEFEVTKMIDESDLNEEGTFEGNADAVVMEKRKSVKMSRGDNDDKIDQIKDINTSDKEAQNLNKSTSDSDNVRKSRKSLNKSNSERVESVHDKKSNVIELRSEIVGLESGDESDKNDHPLNESILDQKSRKSQSMNKLSNSKSSKKDLDSSETGITNRSTDSKIDSGGPSDSTPRLLNRIGSESSDDGDNTLHNKSDHEINTTEKQDSKLNEQKFVQNSLSSIEMSAGPRRAFANRPYTVTEVCMATATSSSSSEDSVVGNEDDEVDIEVVATGDSTTESPTATLLRRIEEGHVKRDEKYAEYCLSSKLENAEQFMDRAPGRLYCSFPNGVPKKKSNSHSTSLQSLRKRLHSATEECSSTEESSNKASDSGGNDAGLSSEDEERLQKITHMKPNGGRNRNHSMVCEKICADAEISGPKNTKRISCGHAGKDFQPSQSFVDDVSERKRKAQIKRKWISTSCVGDNVDLDVTDNDVPHLHKKSKLVGDRAVLLSSTPRNETKDSSAAPNATNDNNNNTHRILSRCHEILEAANKAKLMSKIKNKNIKSSKLKKKRNSKKNAKTKNEEVALDILQLKEGQNDKGKNKQVMEKALKASAEIILNTPGKKKPKLNTTCTKSEENRHLSMQVVEAISNKKKKETLIVKEARDVKMDTNKNSEINHKVMQSSAGCVVEGPLTPDRNKRSNVRKIHLPTGTICEEPLTPVKKPSLLGFRESPMTPKSIGYKVRQILSAGQDTPPEFLSDSSNKDRKKKHAITESQQVQQKPKWSQSGVFIEENMMPVRTINSSGATQFLMSSIGGARKAKRSATSGYPRPLRAANSNALTFKQRAMHRNKVVRESSRELLQRKERRHVRNHF